MIFSNRLFLPCATLGFLASLAAGCANVKAPAEMTGSGGGNGSRDGGGPKVDIVIREVGGLETPIIAGNCGNGTHDDGEECDDGTITGGNGCSPLCQIE